MLELVQFLDRLNGGTLRRETGGPTVVARAQLERSIRAAWMLAAEGVVEGTLGSDPVYPREWGRGSLDRESGATPMQRPIGLRDDARNEGASYRDLRPGSNVSFRDEPGGPQTGRAAASCSAQSGSCGSTRG